MGGRRIKGRPRTRSGQPFDEHEYRDIGRRIALAVGQASSGPTRVYLPSNVVVTGSAYVSLTGLSFPVVAGVMTDFRARVYFTESGTSGGAGLSIIGPASPTRLALLSSAGTSSGAVTQDVGATYDSGTIAGTSLTATGTNILDLFGGIMPSVDGTATIRMAGEATFTATALALISYVEYS